MAWGETLWQKRERERLLAEQFPELQDNSPDKVMQVDNYRSNNGGFVSEFSQRVMRLAKHAAEVAEQSQAGAPIEVQAAADREREGIRPPLTHSESVAMIDAIKTLGEGGFAPGQSPIDELNRKNRIAAGLPAVSDYSPEARALPDFGAGSAYDESRFKPRIAPINADPLAQNLMSGSWQSVAREIPGIAAETLRLTGDLTALPATVPGAALRGALAQGSINPSRLAAGAAMGASHPYSSDPYATGSDVLGVSRLPRGLQGVAGLGAQTLTDAIGAGIYEGNVDPFPTPNRSLRDVAQEAVQAGRLPDSDLIDQSAGVYQFTLGRPRYPDQRIFTTEAGKRFLKEGPSLPGVAGAADKPLTLEDINALKAKVVAEGMTPENKAELEQQLARLFAPDYNAVPEKPPTASDITVNLRRAREAEGRIGGGAESRADMMRRVRDELAASRPKLTPQQERQQQLLTEARANIDKFTRSVEEYEGFLREATDPAEVDLIQRNIDAQRAAIWREISRAAGFDDARPATSGAADIPGQGPFFRPKDTDKPATGRPERWMRQRLPEGPPAKPEKMGPITKAAIAAEEAAERAAREAIEAENKARAGRAPDFLSERYPTGGKELPGKRGFSFRRPQTVDIPTTGTARSTPGDMYRSNLPPLEKPTKERMSFSDVIAEVMSAPISAKGSFDLSFGLRQGAFYVAGHPISAAGNFGRSLRAAASDGGYNEIMARINARPWARIRDEIAKVEITNLNGPINKREEAMASRLFNIIPGYKASQRAYSAFANLARDDLFEKMLRKWGPDWSQVPDDELKRWGKLVNVSTGRGSLPGFLQNNRIAGTPILWAPRFLAARFIMPFELFSSPIVRKEAARQIASFVGVNTALLASAKATGVAEVEMDPRSSDFGQFKVGDRRYDPWAGYRPIVNLLTRVAPRASDIQNADDRDEMLRNIFLTGSRKSTSTGEVFDAGALEIVKDFLRGKLSPTAGTLVNLKWGDALERDVSPRDAAIDLFAPLFLKDMYEAVREEGWMGAAATAPAVVGIGVNSYEKPPLQQALDEQGVDWKNASPGEKDRIRRENPEVARLMDEEAIERGGRQARAVEVRRELEAQQAEADKHLERDPGWVAGWREQTNDRLRELAIRKDEIYADVDFKEGRWPVLEEYFRQLNAAELPDGSIDWDRIEKWRGALPAEDDQFIDENTGLGGTDKVREYRADRRAIAEAGYWDLRDEVFDYFLESIQMAPGSFKFDDFWEEVRRQYRGHAIDYLDKANPTWRQTRPQSDVLLANAEAEKLRGKFDDGLGEYRKQWLAQNMDTYELLVKWGYRTPGAQEAANYAGVGR